MSIVRNARTSRKDDVPSSFLLKWQSSATRGAKPLVRRPTTACQSCRLAKVKCDDRRECSNCISRGIVCRYTKRDSRHRPISTHAPPTPAGPQISSGEIPIAVDVSDATQHSPMDTATYEDVFDSTSDWTNETIPQRLPNLDWGTTDPNLNVSFYGLLFGLPRLTSASRSSISRSIRAHPLWTSSTLCQTPSSKVSRKPLRSFESTLKMRAL